jgi:hypothetical protein
MHDVSVLAHSFIFFTDITTEEVGVCKDALISSYSTCNF